MVIDVANNLNDADFMQALLARPDFRQAVLRYPRLLDRRYLDIKLIHDVHDLRMLSEHTRRSLLKSFIKWLLTRDEEDDEDVGAIMAYAMTPLEVEIEYITPSGERLSRKFESPGKIDEFIMMKQMRTGSSVVLNADGTIRFT